MLLLLASQVSGVRLNCWIYLVLTLLLEGVLVVSVKLGMASFDFSLTMLNRIRGFLYLFYFFSFVFAFRFCFLTNYKLFWQRKDEIIEQFYDYFVNFTIYFSLFSFSFLKWTLSLCLISFKGSNAEIEWQVVLCDEILCVFSSLIGI